MVTEAWDTGATFYLTMTLLSAALIFGGFAPSLYLKSGDGQPPLWRFKKPREALLESAEGLSIGPIGILGLSRVYQVVMPDWNY